MNPIDYAALAEDRSRFFWGLAEWFLAPPDAERLARLPDPDAIPQAPDADALDAAWHALAVAKPQAGSAAVEALGVEFTRLFSGMQEGLGPPPPFESVWREDRLVGESTVAVMEAYAKAGFADIDPTAGPQDHLGVELKFLAVLGLREAEAWRAHDAAGARRRQVQQGDFVEGHLSAWAPRWADAIGEHARAPIYSALAGLAKAGLAQAATELAELQAEAM